MIIKSAAKKDADTGKLKELLAKPGLSEVTREKIQSEIRMVNAGAAGEAEAAYEINFNFGASDNWAVIHDLRIEHAGRVAQIDHLLIGRTLDVWVLETKRFSDGIGINSSGECVMFWNGRPKGIASPHEQNERHIAVLKAVFRGGAVDLPRRLGMVISPELKGLVVVSKGARISRPKEKGWWTNDLVKADQLKSRIFNSDGDSPFGLAKLVSSQTISDLAKQLASLHSPISIDWERKFGIDTPSPAQAKPEEIASPPVKLFAKVPADHAKGKPCKKCGAGVDARVAAFCRFNKSRFGGEVYCMACQPAAAGRPTA